MTEMTPTLELPEDWLIVFSHLRWDFVYQRPQHLMTRLARHFRILFIEEPLLTHDEPHWKIMPQADGVSVCRPYTRIDAPGFDDAQTSALRHLIGGLMADRGVVEPVVWLYTPLALPLIEDLRARVVVYDCMDELAAFDHAPRKLAERENSLLQVADVVFTGGPSLYAAKQPRHRNVHCFASSVDCAHFAAARDPARECSESRALLHSHPRLGFFGVIDERMDIALLDGLARAHPEWQIILIGPIVKIDPALLPRHANIHYLGPRPYDELPGFLAGWDVCLLPFAQNAATRYISPTKTLEYMAAEKPIVSTPITDVATPYGHVVRIGAGHQFIEACEKALAETPEQREQRVHSMRKALSATSWDKTVAEMLACVIRYRSPAALPEIVREARVTLTTDPPPIVIIGAGPTGLSAAYHLGDQCVLLEQHARVGGWCRSIVDHGFTFDYAGHIMFSNDAEVQRLYRTLLGDNVHWQDREAWIYSKDVYSRYPFQGALYGLPTEVILECLVGAAKAQQSRRSDEAPANFEDFIHQVWGAGIAKHFAIPYNRKLWAVPLSSMETSWLGGRVPIPDLAEMIEGALRPVAKAVGPNARFGYPLRGGFQALMDGFLEPLGSALHLNATVVQVIPSRRHVVLASGDVHRYQRLISTMPLPVLVKMIGAEAPAAVRQAAARLRYVSVRCVNIGVDRPNITDKHWIYYPEETIFHRIFAQGNASPHNNPTNGFGLTCEITYSPDKPLPCEGELLVDRCIDECTEVGLLHAEDRILARHQVDMPFAYVVYDHGREAAVAVIREWAGTQGIFLAGRYSEWEYYNSDHAFMAGRRAAEAARAAVSRDETVRAPRELPSVLL